MPDRPDTFIILTPAFPADETDSAWVPSKQLFVRTLKEQYPDLHIIVISFLYPAHTNVYKWHGLTVIPFNGMQKRKLSRLMLWRRIWKKLASLKNEHNIVGIFSFWCGECALVGKYFAKWNRLKHLCWISGMDAKKENRLIKLIQPKPGELVAMSDFLVNKFHNNHRVKPRFLVPIGIDTREFHYPDTIKDIDILGVGSFNPFKQYDLFIRVIKEVTNRQPGIKAVIIGDGTEKEKLKAQVAALQLENNISFLGMIHHSEVIKHMQRAKIFLHPSAYEGFGAVCIEALYAGAQVISFCKPMQQDINHWQIVKSENEMTAKVLELLEQDTLCNKPVLFKTMAASVNEVMQLYK